MVSLRNLGPAESRDYLHRCGIPDEWHDQLVEVSHGHPLGLSRELSFVEAGPDGLYPHDLARDALDADLRWRDPDAYRQVFRDVQRHVHASMRASRRLAQQRAAFDLKFMYRNLPSVLSPIDWEAWGQVYPEPAGIEDRSRWSAWSLPPRERSSPGSRPVGGTASRTAGLWSAATATTFGVCWSWST